MVRNGWGPEDLQTIILARGKGTRLRPFSIHRPKSLCPICNRSILTRLLNQLTRSGIRTATLTMNRMPEEIWQRFERERPNEISVEPLFSDAPSKGSVHAVLDCLDDRSPLVLVVYGDSLLQLDFRALVDEHVKLSAPQCGPRATMVYHEPEDLRTPREDGTTYHGVLAVDRTGRVVRFQEKPLAEEIGGDFRFANAAVFVLDREVLELDSVQKAADFSRNVFEPAANFENTALRFHFSGFNIGSGFRYDTGNVGRFFRANMRILRRFWHLNIPGSAMGKGVWVGPETNHTDAVIRPPVLLGRAVELGKGCRLGPGAIIGDGCSIGLRAEIENSVLMEGCIVGSGAKLEQSVVGGYGRISSGVRVPAGAALGDYSAVGATDLLEERWQTA